MRGEKKEGSEIIRERREEETKVTKTQALQETTMEEGSKSLSV